MTPVNNNITLTTEYHGLVVSSGLVAPNIVLVANAVGLVASYVDLCMLVS